MKMLQHADSAFILVEGAFCKQVMVENTHLAIEEEDTSHFLAEGQPSIGRQGHLKATGMHR